MEDDCEEIFTMIESAIFSAASENPREFSVRRSRIAEILFTVLKAPYNSSQQSCDGEVATQKSNTPTQQQLMYHGGNYLVKPTTTRQKSSAVPKVCGKVQQANHNSNIKKTNEHPRHISKIKKTSILTQEELDQRLLQLYHGRNYLIGQNASPVKPATGKVEAERKPIVFKIRLRPKEGQELQKPTSDRVALKHTTISSINTASPVPAEKSSAGLIKKSKPIINKEAQVHQQVRKRDPLDDEAIQQKLEASKKKLKTGYDHVQEAKERKKIQMIELKDLPRQPLERCSSTQKFKRPPIRTRFY